MAFLDFMKSEPGQVLIAGGAGATASAVNRWPGLTVALRRTLVGVLTAFYLTPYASPVFKWLANISEIPADRALYPGAFILGAVGCEIFETIVQIVRFRSQQMRGKSDVEGDGHD